jgi:hypothetical protein
MRSMLAPDKRCRVRRSTQHFSNRLGSYAFNEEPLFWLCSIRPKQGFVFFKSTFANEFSSSKAQTWRFCDSPQSSTLASMFFDYLARALVPLPNKDGLHKYRVGPDAERVKQKESSNCSSARGARLGAAPRTGVQLFPRPAATAGGRFCRKVSTHLMQPPTNWNRQFALHNSPRGRRQHQDATAQDGLGD